MLYPKHSEEVPVNIISADRKIPVQDAKMFLNGFPFQSVNEDPREYFSKEIVKFIYGKVFQIYSRPK